MPMVEMDDSFIVASPSSSCAISNLRLNRVWVRLLGQSWLEAEMAERRQRLCLSPATEAGPFPGFPVDQL